MASGNKQQGPTPKSGMPSASFGGGAKFRMPADYAKRLHEARNFSHNAERSAYLGQTNQRDGTAQNPGVGHPEKHLVVAISCPNTTAQRLTYGLVSYAALTVVDDGTRAQKWSMQAIACLMNADLGVLSSNGREDGGIMLVTAPLRYDTNLLLQALAVQENYNNLDAQVQADLTEEEWAAALEMAPLILAAGGAEADSVIYVLGYMLLKNVGGNERYMSEGFNSLRTALVGVRTRRCLLDLAVKQRKNRSCCQLAKPAFWCRRELENFRSTFPG